MYTRGRSILQSHLARRLVVGLALGSYLAVAIGAPLPARTSVPSGPSFPCQAHACGCRSAEQCWSQCCCYTPGQRLAWAEAQGVRPPACAELPLEQGWHTVRLRDQGGPSCCTPATNDGTSSCCEGPQGPSACCRAEEPAVGAPVATVPPPAEGSDWVLGVAAARCRGLGTLWITTGAVLAPPPPAGWQPVVRPAGWLILADVPGSSFPTPPPDPPPRSAPR